MTHVDGMGLRERKKLRTRLTIERVALDLFADRGFQATTLAEIAQAAEVAPSTLHVYFPSKDDILFSLSDALYESARSRLLERSESERLVDALHTWISDDVPGIVGSDGGLVRHRRAIIDSDETLLAQDRLRTALFEDLLAEAFARDFGESPDDLRSRLMASIAVNGLRAVWFWWYRHQGDGHSDPREPYALDATYLTSLIRAAEGAIEALPNPPDHFSGA